MQSCILVVKKQRLHIFIKGSGGVRQRDGCVGEERGRSGCLTI